VPPLAGKFHGVGSGTQYRSRILKSGSIFSHAVRGQFESLIAANKLLFFARISCFFVSSVFSSNRN